MANLEHNHEVKEQKMFKRWIMIALLLVLGLPLQAQDTTPPAVREGALDAAEAALGVRSDNWRFEVLQATTNSALGCPLVQGEEMPFSVTPYRVEVIYPDGVYVVHVSADGRLTQLCDPRFGSAMTNPITPEDACKAAPAATVPAYAAPSTAVQGVFAAASGQTYRVYGVSAEGSWLQIGLDQMLGWVEAGAMVLSGDCSDLLVTAFTSADARGVCFLSPASVISNVRARPTTDAEIVAQIYENSLWQAIARNTAGDWLFMQAGWVSTSVLRTQGDCVDIDVSDTLVGAGFASDDPLPSTVDTDAARALAVYRCPADFAGYLPTRIQIGNATARVTAGDAPNAVRAFPSLDETVGTRLGTLAPGSVVDRVISGPACNQGIVWWLIEAGALTGWTAESNSGSGSYLLEPPDLTAAPDPNTWVQNDRPVTALAFTSSGSRLFSAGEEAGFGDTPAGFVNVWDLLTGAAVGRIPAPVGVVAMAYAPAADALVVAAGSGIITLYAAAELDIPGIAVLADAFVPASVAPRLAIAPDAEQLAVAACENADCAAWRLTVYDTAGGEALWSQSLPQPVTALAFSLDGTQLAVASSTQIQFWTIADGSAGTIYQSADGMSILALQYKLDGSGILYAGCAQVQADACIQGRVGLLDASGALIGLVATHRAEARLLVISPDGRRFATSDGSEVIIRDSATGTETQAFTLDPDSAVSIAWTPASDRLAVGTADGRILFLDVPQP